MYTEKLGGLIPLGTVGGAVLTATGVLAHRYLALSPARIKRVYFKVTTATVSTGNIVITAKKRPTLGSATAEVTLCTITIATAVAANAVYYKDFAGVTVNPGDELCFDVTTAAAGGGAAGAGFGMCELEHSPEQPLNLGFVAG